MIADIEELVPEAQEIEEELDEAPYEVTKERKVLIQPYDYAVRM
jgi:hypothetical protein